MVSFISFSFLPYILPQTWRDLSLGSEKGRHLSISSNSGPGLCFGAHRAHLRHPRWGGGWGIEAETAQDRKTHRVGDWKELKDRWSTAHFPEAPRAQVICSRSPNVSPTSSFIRSFIHQVSIEYLMCPRPCTEFWGSRDKKDMVLPWREHMLMGKLDRWLQNCNSVRGRVATHPLWSMKIPVNICCSNLIVSSTAFHSQKCLCLDTWMIIK